MPARSRVPAYSLHKPSSRAVVKVKGRSFYLGRHGSPESKDAYGRIIADLLAGRQIKAPNARSAPPEEPKLSVGELLREYRAYASGYYVKGGRETSEVASIRCALAYVEPYAQAPVDAYDVVALKVVREAMIDAGLCRSFVNQNAGRIVLAFRWAVTERLYAARLMGELEALKGLRAGRTRAPEPERVTPVSDEVIDATIPHLPAVVAAMVRLQRATGMRPGEVCAVRPCDVDCCRVESKLPDLLQPGSGSILRNTAGLMAMNGDLDC